MKNYKHSVKSNNAMKLAAVASAAIMMAPVALNSVSTFAATPATTTIATGAIPSTEAGFNTSLAIAKAVLKAAQVNGSDAAKTAVQSAKTDKGESATNWMNEIKAADAFLALAKKNGIDPTGAGVKSAKATFTADEIGEPGSWYVDQANGVPTCPLNNTDYRTCRNINKGGAQKCN